MKGRRVWVLASLLAVLVLGPTQGAAGAESGAATARYKAKMQATRAAQEKRVTQADREAAADRVAALVAKAKRSGARVLPPPGPGDTPDYFGLAPNWAYSPPLRKFVDSLPGLGDTSSANNLGQYIPLATPDTTTYPGSDYYEIELRQYTEKMHTDMPPTTLRGYVQTNYGTDGGGQNTIAPAPIHYLGPTIAATKNRPVRIKFTNKLPTGEAGDLFLPVDTTIMGAGMGPLGMDVPEGMPMNYTENRGTLHLHGGKTPWISDGTAHQWITPAGENTPYPRGVSVRNVPDMPDPGDGSMTFYYTNQQSARMMFYHDHSFGITRLNVYAGEAAGYLITDDAEQALLDQSLIPTDQIPLVIQDRTFVDSSTIATTDPTWNWGTTAPTPNDGDLWYPHVYVPAQNPGDPSGMAAMGRWHYGPWFWPPTPVTYPPVDNPYYDPANAPWEPKLAPGVPDVSSPGEAFMDTAIVNGTAFPKVTVDPKSYRFRILNAADDRFWNLQLYEADPATQSADGRFNTEVKMVAASVCATNFPELWPTDGREGGVPDPSTAGPEFIQIASESGFLPAPAVIPQQPVTWNLDPTTFNFGNVEDHALLLAPAERADVVIDFSAYAGKTLILYNDAPTAFPALDPRTDYYTNDPDRTDTGGHWGTEVGYGPNTRTIMQINVTTATAAPAFQLAPLQAAFASSDSTEGVFESSQDPVIVPDSRYDSAYNDTFTADPYARIFTKDATFTTLTGDQLHFDFKPKAIQDEMGEAYDLDYGRMSVKLGLELQNTTALNQNFVLQNFVDPPTEILNDSVTPMSPVLGDGTQIWKITHNGVDTHPIHFHLYDVQLINRVGWDNGVRPPDDNELGWKDTVRVSPLEDTIVALRPTAPKQPFGVPDSIRPFNPAEPIGSTMGFTSIDPYTAQPIVPPVTNQLFNFGWEYVIHCHILAHEEMDMMRPVVFNVDRSLADASSLSATGTPGGDVQLTWTDPTPWNGVAPASTLGDLSNEIGFRVERAAIADDGTIGSYTTTWPVLANVTSFTDTTTVGGANYRYRVVAYNAAGDTPSSPVYVGLPPTAPSSLVATLQAGPQVFLTWTDNATTEAGFVVERSVNGGGFAQFTARPRRTRSGTGTVTYTDTTVEPDNTYAYRVAAENPIGLSAYTNTDTVEVIRPAAPTGLGINIARDPGASDLVTLNWTDNSYNERGFVVQRALNSGFSSGVLSFNVSANATSFAQSIAHGATYYYRVRATNYAGNSGWSNTVNATTIPAVPSNFRLTGRSRTSISLAWSNNSSNEQGFVIQRRLGTGAWITATTREPNTTSWTNTGLIPNTSYGYRIRAYNGIGTSDWSAAVQTTTLP